MLFAVSVSIYSSDSHVNEERVVRESKYFLTLPTFSLYCSAIDGDAKTTPIIFEDVYWNPVPSPQPSQRRARFSSHFEQECTNFNGSNA